MLFIVMLSSIMLNAFMPSVVFFIATQGVVLFNVVVLSVVASVEQEAAAQQQHVATFNSMQPVHLT